MTLKLKYIFLLVASTLFFVGCASKTLRPAEVSSSASWSSKAQIRDLIKNKQQNVGIDLYAIKDQKMRMEVSATLGYQVASVVMDPEEISYVVYPQKRHYYGKNSENAFAKVLGISINPMNLSNIAFDQPIRGRGWTCSQGETGQLKSCENLESKTEVRYVSREEGRKKVHILSPNFEMIWVLEPPEALEAKPEIFTLKVPSGYKEIKIN